LAPGAYVAVHANQLPPDPRAFGAENGDALGFETVNVREGSLAFGMLWDGYQQWFSQGVAPVVTTIQSSPPNQIAYGYGYSPLQTMLPSTALFGQTWYPNMRFGLGIALMNDGFFVHDFGDTSSPVTWWYDEYNFNLGTPLGPYTQIGTGPSANLLTNGGFEGTLSPWVFGVNNDGSGAATVALDTTTKEDGNSSAHVDVTSPATANWHIVLRQGNLPVTAGQEYVAQFWAKADVPLQITVAIQGGNSPYAHYTPNTLVTVGTAWAQYSVSVISNATATDAMLEFYLGTQTGNLWLDDVSFTVAPERIYRRDFSGGVVVLNGTASPQTVPLEAGLQHFSGSQAPKYQYIVDDTDAGFSSSGSWISDTFDTGFRKASGPYYHAWKSTCHELDSSSGSAQWNLNLPADGQYTIQVWLPAAPPASTWTKQAVYEVWANGSIVSTFTLDQSQASGGDQWYTIASNLNLTAASAPYVQLSNGGTGPLIADAVYVSSSTALYNDGSAAPQVTLAPFDSVLLQWSTADQTISFRAVSGQTLANPALPLSASASSGLPISFASNTPTVCLVAGSTATLVATGTCSITASQPGNASYTAAVPVTQTFAVGPAFQPQTISFAAPANQLAGVTVTLSATASSGLPVTFTSNSTVVCTVLGNTVVSVTAGICSITASQAGNASYAAAVSVTNTFSFGLLQQTITFGPQGNQYVGTTMTPAASASSGLPVTFSTTTPSICTASGTSLTMLAAGTCIAVANQAGNLIYSPAPGVTRWINVVLNPQTITFTAIPGQTVGTSVGLSATSSAGLPVLFTSNSPSICSVSGSTVTELAAGTCSISASQAGNATYAAAVSITNYFTVSMVPQTITFGPQPNQFAGTTVTPVATASSGLPVTFTTTTPSICTASGANVTMLIAGTCIAVANQAGNAIYAAAPGVTRWINVVLSSQTINFNVVPTLAVGTSAVLPATASSGLTVSFSSTTPSVCTVSGNAANALSIGVCTITATQPGNSAYTAAASVTQSFAVVVASQTIAFATVPVQALGAVPLAINASASSGLPVTFGSTTPTVCSVSGSTVSLLAPGTCSITATQAGSATYAAAPPVTQQFTVAANLILNGGFETGTIAPWQLQVNNDGSASATASLDNSSPADGAYAMHVNIASAAMTPWHIKLVQGSLAVTSGSQYTVQFWARSSVARTIQVCLQGGAPSYSYYGLYTTVSIGTTWSLYTLTFAATTTAADGMLELRLGSTAGDVWFDDVQMFATGN
jgi:hypothetical protein